MQRCKKRRGKNKIDPNIYIRTIQKDQLNLESNKIQKRGPDDNQFVMLPKTANFHISLGFHRLAINDLSSEFLVSLKLDFYCLCSL